MKHLHKATPEAAIKPTSTEQISEVMKLAFERDMPVTPRHGGISLSTEAVPIYRRIKSHSYSNQNLSDSDD
jgi:FAD/FMN-containing dehydrogenase